MILLLNVTHGMSVTKCVVINAKIFDFISFNTLEMYGNYFSILFPPIPIIVFPFS